MFGTYVEAMTHKRNTGWQGHLFLRAACVENKYSGDALLCGVYH